VIAGFQRDVHGGAAHVAARLAGIAERIDLRVGLTGAAVKAFAEDVARSGHDHRAHARIRPRESLRARGQFQRAAHQFMGCHRMEEGNNGDSPQRHSGHGEKRKGEANCAARAFRDAARDIAEAVGASPLRPGRDETIVAPDFRALFFSM